MEVKDLVTIVGIGVTLFIGLLNLFISVANNKRTTFINAVTSERVKWMGKLRELISEYVELTALHFTKAIYRDEKERSDYLDNIIRINSQIKLMLNYKDPEDIEIIKMVDDIKNSISYMYELHITLQQEDEKRVASFKEQHKSEIMSKTIELLKVDYETWKSSVSDDGDFSFEKFRDAIGEYYIDAFNEVASKHNQEIRSKINEANDKLTNGIDKLVGKVQAYLKREWNRVKEEAEFGNVIKNIEWKSLIEIKTIKELSEWRFVKIWKETIILKKMLLILLMITLVALVIA